MRNQQDSNKIDEAQDTLITQLVETESQRELEIIEKKLQVIRRLKD